MDIDHDDLFKALTGTSSDRSSKDRRDDREDRMSGLDDDDDDSMDDDMLIDGRNRAEDLEFKTSFGLGLFSSNDTNTILADRDPKTLTMQEQEKLKEKLHVEERERMQ